MIGAQCRCVFSLPHNEWPFPGYPAWVRVLDVDMPMVKMCSGHYDNQPKWVNCATITEIELVELKVEEKHRGWFWRWVSL